MSITIVASFAQPAVPGASAAGGATDPLAVDDASIGLDFASMLLTLPVVNAAPLPPGSSRQPGPGDQATLPEAAAALAGHELLAMLGLNQPNQANQPPPMQPAHSVGRLHDAEIAEPSHSWPPPGAPLLASATTTSATRAGAQGAYPGSDERGELPSMAPLTSISDGKAAKFAVADLVAQAFAQNEAKRPEQQLSSASNLATLGPASQAPNTAIAQETSLGLQTALRDPSWATDFGQKLLWFAANDKQLAQLTLNPPQLGAVEITLKIDKDGANAHFVSANADVRGAIETALPRLREMFASAGIDLGQVSVGSESFRQSADSQRQTSGPPRPMADTAILGGDSVSGLLSQSIVAHRGSALVDTFA
jgi:flagellar hook-length control protein FliK